MSDRQRMCRAYLDLLFRKLAQATRDQEQDLFDRVERTLRTLDTDGAIR